MKIVHPGIELKKSFIDKYQLSVAQLAQAVGISQPTLRQFIIGKTKASPSISLKLSKYLGTAPSYWFDLQNAFDLAEAKADTKLQSAVKDISKAKLAVPSKGAKAKPGRKPKDAAAPKTPAKRGRKPGAAKAPAAKPAGAKRGRKPKTAPDAAAAVSTPSTTDAGSPISW